MALKKIFIFNFLLALFVLLCGNIVAQDQHFNFTDAENVDSTIVDTATIDTSGFKFEEIKADTLTWKVKSLPQVEEQVRSLQDSFFYDKREFLTNTYYRSENNFYTLSNSQSDYYLGNTRINCLVWNDFNILPLLNFFPYKNENGDIKFSELDLKFKAPFSSITYESGAHSKEAKSFYLVKNDFLATVKGGGQGIADIQLFLNSGSEEAPSGNKNYFDNLTLGISRDFGNLDLKYNFIKSFYERDRFITYYPPIDNKIGHFEPQKVTFRNSYFINLLVSNQ